MFELRNLGGAVLALALVVSIVGAPTQARTSNLPTIAELALGSDDLRSLVVAVVDTGLATTLAEDGPLTVFAPVNSAFEGVDVGALTPEELTNVLLDHVVDGSYTSRDIFQLRLTRSTLVTRGGLELKFRGNRINGNRILATNISAGNGTIHLIDGVLLED